jgi:putative ABC transport system permease protein
VLLTRPLAEALGAVHRELTLSFRPLKDQVNAALIQERIVALLSGFFGTLALLLAGLGLYGITSYAVNRRKAELGIRMALGAAPANVVRLVLQRVAMLVSLGIAAGLTLAGAFIVYGDTVGAETVAALLYGVKLRDPLTFGTAVVVLAAIAAFAGWLPARRASRIDPAVVLRS